MVRAGDTLATLEDRELSLERLRWVTERQQRVFEHDRALASRQPATINVVKSQIDQADAQLRLIDEQIARTKLTAPFDLSLIHICLQRRSTSLRQSLNMNGASRLPWLRRPSLPFASIAPASASAFAVAEPRGWPPFPTPPSSVGR